MEPSLGTTKKHTSHKPNVLIALKIPVNGLIPGMGHRSSTSSQVFSREAEKLAMEMTSEELNPPFLITRSRSGACKRSPLGAQCMEQQGATQCHTEHLCKSQGHSPQCSDFPSSEELQQVELVPSLGNCPRCLETSPVLC